MLFANLPSLGYFALCCEKLGVIVPELANIFSQYSAAV